MALERCLPSMLLIGEDMRPRENGEGLVRMTASQYFTFAGPMLLTVVACGLVTIIVAVVCGLHYMRRVVRVLESLEESARREPRNVKRSVSVRRR